MWRYATKILRPYLDTQQISTDLLDDIISKLIGRAEGVFLWLYLVIRILIDGLENGDNKHDLLRRLEILPNELSKLYSDMWNRLNENRQIYRKNAARYFNLVLMSNEARVPLKPQSVFLLAIALEPSLQAQCLDEHAELDYTVIDRVCTKARHSILIQSAGLLEVSRSLLSYGFNHSGHYNHCVDEQLRPHIESQVHFIHRTAYDFLVDTEEGHQIRRYDPSSREDLYMQLIRCYLARCRLGRFGNDYIEPLLSTLSDIEEPSLHNQVLEILHICWKWFDRDYLKEYGDIGNNKLKRHFLSVATYPKFIPYILQQISSGSEASVLATKVLHGQRWARNHSYDDTHRSFVKSLLALGADTNIMGDCPGARSWCCPFKTAFTRFLHRTLAGSSLTLYSTEAETSDILELILMFMDTSPDLEDVTSLTLGVAEDIKPLFPGIGQISPELINPSADFDLKTSMEQFILILNLASLIHLVLERLVRKHYRDAMPMTIKVQKIFDAAKAITMQSNRSIEVRFMVLACASRVRLYRISDPNVSQKLFSTLRPTLYGIENEAPMLYPRFNDFGDVFLQCYPNSTSYEVFEGFKEITEWSSFLEGVDCDYKRDQYHFARWS
jgi:hypothetical protein